MAKGRSYEKYAAEVDALIAADDMEALAHHLVDTGHQHVAPGRRGLTIADALAALPEATVLRLLLALTAVPGRDGDDVRAYRRHVTLHSLIESLDALLPTRPADGAAAELLASAVRHPDSLPADRIAALVKWHHARGQLSAPVITLLQARAPGSRRLRRLAGELGVLQVLPGEPWTDRILADLPALDPVWGRIVAHAGTAVSAGPSAPWTTKATDLLVAVGVDEAHRVLAGWLSAVTTRTAGTDTYAASDVNGDALRGLLWMLPLTPVQPATVRLIGALTEAMLRRLPGVGPASPKIANATVLALSRIDGEASLAQLARLSVRVTYKGTLNEIGKALDARAAALGMTTACDTETTPSLPHRPSSRPHASSGYASAAVA